MPQAADLADLVTLTLQDLGERKWTDLTSDLQEHIVMPSLIQKNNVVLASGYGLKRNVKVDKHGNVRWTSLYSEDITTVRDSMRTIDVPFRHVVASWAFDEHEISMNSGPRQLVDLMKTRENGCMGDLVENLESKFFLEVDDTELDPWGLPHYVVKNNTEGFNGGNPTGYSNVAGLSHDRWKNYSGQYTAVTKADLITKLRKAAYKTNFKAPVANTPQYAGPARYRHLTNYAVSANLVDVLEAQNENLGNDVASKEGLVMFMRRPVEVVPMLDADTTNPWYGVNMSTFMSVILRGWNIKRTTIPRKADQHNVAETYYDLSINWLCVDRRKNWVLATNTGGV